MENETRPQLFIMDEWLGDPIPLAEIKEISEYYIHLVFKVLLDIALPV